MNRSRGLTTLAVVLLIGGAILLIVGIAMNGRIMFGELQGGGYGYGYWDGTEEIVPGIIMLAAGAAILIIRYVLANKAKTDMTKADVTGEAEKVKSVLNQKNDNVGGAEKVSVGASRSLGNAGVQPYAASEEKTVLLKTARVVLVDSSGKETEIASDIFILGRSAAKSNYVINSPLVSSAHAQIIKKEGNLFIKDLNSSNHTYVNGTQIGNEAVMLHNGDVIRLAKEEFKVNVS